MKTYQIACIPGDGIGKEVIPAGQQVLQALAATQRSFAFEFSSFGWGGDWYRRYGVMMPEDGLDELKGPCPDQRVPSVIRSAAASVS